MINSNNINIIENYVDDNFFSKLIELIPTKEKISVHRNQILRYGSNVPYDHNIISEEIPDIFLDFKKDFDFDSVTINEYYPNQYIDWHIDQPKYGQPIIILSLLSDAVLEFRKDKEKLSFNIPKNSLTTIKDELRNEWEHSLRATKKRYSIIFRNSKLN